MTPVITRKITPRLGQMNRPGEVGDSGCCLAGLGEGRAASAAGTVVRTRFPRRAPTRSSSRISRSTVHRATGVPSRFS